MTRRIWIPLGIVVGVLVMGAVGLWAAWRFTQPALRERIIAEARVRGFELDMEEFSVSPEEVVLTNATVRPIGVRGIAARLDSVTLSLAGLTWKSVWGGSDAVSLTGIAADGADVHILGSAPSLALELSRWSEQYPAAYDLPANAKNVALGWRAEPENAPWLLIAQGEVARGSTGGTFETNAASVLGKHVGKVGSSWSKQDGRIVMGFGQVDPGQAPVHLEVLLDAPEPVARLELRRTPLDALTGALGITLPLDADVRRKTHVEAKAELKLPPSLAPTPVLGSLEVTLFGFIPPHPPELQGIVSGDRTTFSTQLEVSADQSGVKLTETKVAAGAFVLEGDGLVQRTADHAQVHLRLSESLACVKLAGAAADSRLGKHWASLTRQLLKKYMQGSVQVLVHVEADTRDLGGARVTQTIGVGCGLQPLRPPTQEDLAALSKQLPGLIAELPKLPNTGFTLPSGLPALPPLPPGLPALPTTLPTLPKQLPPPTTELSKLPVAPKADAPPAETGSE